MSGLRQAKQAILKAGRATGAFALVRGSGWRAQRLLILCYHGISKEDEHEWNPGLYIPQAKFRERMELLRSGGYRVLPLDESLRLLQLGKLPPRSVAITFDDGAHDFFTLAYPVLKEFGYASTVYLTTYYCLNQLPVFDVVSSYVLWKGRARLEGNTGWRERARRLYQEVRENKIGAAEKDSLAEDLAQRLGVDYQRIRDHRILYLMNPAEVKTISENGVSIELHTHRHRTPRDRALFEREIVDNRKEIVAITGKTPTHFCYPSGDYVPEFFGWLRDLGVQSATTCVTGLAASSSNIFELPRLLDVDTLTDIEVEGWLTGLSALLPARSS
ncbi:MAG: polysaccharide deacetylase family protein [Acidobacteriota bacterium]|nr:polysaccharide deacetylase family protein [Acidobacteriota bacterium]